MNFMVKNIRFGREWFGRGGRFKVSSLQTLVTIKPSSQQIFKICHNQKRKLTNELK
jgi:hypothetical protein